MPASDEREEQLAFPEIRAVKIFLIKIGRGLVIEGAETMGHLEHESSNLSEEAFARASKRLIGKC